MRFSYQSVLVVQMILMSFFICQPQTNDIAQCSGFIALTFMDTFKAICFVK